MQAVPGSLVTGATAPARGVSADEYLLGWGPLGVMVIVLLAAVIALWKQRNADQLRHEAMIKAERDARAADQLRHETKMYEMVDAATEVIDAVQRSITR
jgi:hypothetical protein